MASPTGTTPSADPPIVFRASKKRKAGLRQRAALPDDAAPAPNPADGPQPGEPTSSTDVRSEDGETEAIPSALRYRARRRLNGVGFTNSRAATTSDDKNHEPSTSRALVPATATPDEDPLIAKSFAPQTGLATTVVDKHMMEYIESHLSSRKSPVAEASSSSNLTASKPPLASSSAAAAAENEPRAHPIMQGKLMEVDLGDEVRARNQAMTEKAARRLLGENVIDEDAESGGRRAKKPRLGRDGKPWRPRNRRGSDDIKRDQLVEEILRENKLDVYDVPTAQQTRYEGEGDADDRVAEEFRREFMDAMIQRRRKKKTAPAPTRAGARKADEDVLKGPKLGGSRNSRAAMRDLLLKKEKESKR